MGVWIAWQDEMVDGFRYNWNSAIGGRDGARNKAKKLVAIFNIREL